MKNLFVYTILLLLISCSSEKEHTTIESNDILKLNFPKNFPPFNKSFTTNKPTKFGVILGKKLFNDKRLSKNNSISCASCHIQKKAFADNNPTAKGIFNKKALRNVPALQNLAYLKHYTWDGNHISIEDQVLVPIITKEEMGSNILEVINKIKKDPVYIDLFHKVYGEKKINGEKIYNSIAQYEYTLISANSKYDNITKDKLGQFSEEEQKGQTIFKEKCAQCHPSPLFTDQTFRNIGFPINPNQEELGRARVTRNKSDYLKFRVPSLRNIAYTAPYGSFGQFKTIREVLDYMDKGVIASENLDVQLKKQNNRIPLSSSEKEYLIAFLNTLSDPEFTTNKNY